MSTNYAIILIFVIIDAVLMGWCYKAHILWMDRCRKEIESVEEALDGFGSDEYTSRFEDISKIFQGSAYLRGVWDEFRKILTRHEDGGSDMRLYAPIDAGEYFRFDEIARGMSLSYWQGFGGIFTGIGLFGTFLGLVWGLWGVDLSSSDIAVLKDGISALLGGIYLAFITSLIGLACALLYGFWQHRGQERLERAVSSLTDTVERMYPRRTEEQWLADSFHEHREQTKALKNLSQDVAEQLGEVLDAQLSTDFDKLCDRLDSQMKPVFEKLYDAIKALNEGGASAIAGAVSEKTGAQLEAFAGMLQTIQETIRQNMEAFQRITVQTNEMVASTVQEVGASLSQGAEAAAKQQKEAAGTMREAAQPVSEAADRLREEQLAVQEETARLHEALAKQMEALSAQGSQNEWNLQKLMTAIETSEQGIREAWERYRQNFDGVSGELTKMTDIITAKLGEYNEAMASGMSEQLRSFDKTVSNATGSLGSLVEQLDELLEDLLEASGKRSQKR